MVGKFGSNLQGGILPPHPFHPKENLVVFYQYGGPHPQDRKYVGKLDKVLLINVSLPPFDKYKLCHPFNLLCNLISIGSQMAFDKYIRDPFKKNSILHSFLMSI